jgi:ubiquinone/menaquinone biosynthesis C-methylase UbiE
VSDWRSYDGVAQTYQRVHAPRLAEVARDLIQLAGVEAGDQVLDVGTGTGAAAAEMESTGARVVGVDPSVGMLMVARETHPKLQFAAASAIDLPFANGVFDKVVGNFVLAHFKKVDTALFDIMRVVKTGGGVSFSSWSDGPDAYQQAWRDLIESVVPREMLEPAYAQAAPWHEKFRSRNAVEQALIDAGLRHVRTETRHYRFVYPRKDYLEGLEVWATGRFVREMLGESGWTDLMTRAEAEFADKFPDPLNDFRDVILAVGTKP